MVALIGPQNPFCLLNFVRDSSKVVFSGGFNEPRFRIYMCNNQQSAILGEMPQFRLNIILQN